MKDSSKVISNGYNFEGGPPSKKYRKEHIRFHILDAKDVYDDDSVVLDDCVRKWNEVETSLVFTKHGSPVTSTIRPKKGSWV